MSGVALRAIVYRPAFGRDHAAKPAERPRLTIVRSAVPGDVTAIHELIAGHAAEGRLLTRAFDEIASHVNRFVVATQNNQIVGCADLAPLSGTVAEVRSLVVDPAARAQGVGRRLLRELLARAATADFETLCAFTHSPSYFVRAGFSVVPHAWLPEKIERDCRSCSMFQTCGQYAVTFALDAMATRVGAGAVNG